MGNLQGQCAIVTGAAYGIGFAAAKRFAEEGASVVIADIKGYKEAAQKLRDAGADAVGIHADVTDDESVNNLVAKVMETFGRIDILLNNAAISAELKPAPFEKATASEWARIYDVNVIGVFRMCRAVSSHMRAAGQGRIINVASGTAFKGIPGMMHYIASKGAIISMTRALANEFGGDNVIVNAVSPGMTITESVEQSPELLEMFTKNAVATRAIKRGAVPTDVANVIYFLASPDSGFVTGQVVAADGGSVYH